MPELPEVETIRRGLVPVLEGHRIAHVTVNRADLRRPLPAHLAERLAGRQVLRLGRRSKYLLGALSGGETLVVHLGMTGRLQVSGRPLGACAAGHALPARHDHVIFDVEGGARVTFNDPRRFGSIDLVPTEGLDERAPFRDLGPEPLGNGFDAVMLARRLAGRRAPLKTALLDQHVVAGLGNIYVCEALWRARLSPLAPAGSVPPGGLERLVQAIRAVLEEAIAAGGSSLRDHRQTNGEPGYFQHDFRVYGREGQPCLHPGCPGTIARISQSGRSTWFCPVCQPPPGAG